LLVPSSAALPELLPPSQSIVLGESTRNWQGVELSLVREDIALPAEWAVHRDRHTVIIHRGGSMIELDTEIEGKGASHPAANPGDTWTIPAGLKYHGRARGGEIQYAVLRVEPARLKDLAGQREPVELIAPCQARHDEFLYQMIERLARLVDCRDDVSVMLGESICRTLCLHLVSEYRAHDAVLHIHHSTPTLNRIQTERCRQYIQDHLAESIELDSLATEMGMTVHLFLAAFRKAFGTSPMQYVIVHRLTRARGLLTHTRSDITSIAVACGFSSHSHLTSTFKKHLGMTPSQFRQRHSTRQ
jgi:AraC family transcriptional regulator